MSTRHVNSTAALILAALLVIVVANGMTKPLGRDEQMYCTGAVLLAQGKAIYKDFSYPSQMPCHPLLYAALFKIFNTQYYLLVGRTTSIVCDILVVLSIIGIYRCIFRPSDTCGTWLGLAGAALYLFNPLVDYANGYAWNHDVVILCVILSFWLFISTNSTEKPKYWRAAAIGALLTFATCMRITTALVQLLFFAFILARPAPSVRHRFENILQFLLASAIVLLWPAWTILRAWQPFLLNLIRIPTLYGQWLHKIGMTHGKRELIYNSLTTPGCLALILIVIYVCLIALWQRRRLAKPGTPGLLLAALLAMTFFIIALIPPTMWIQYLAMPVPFLIVCLAYPLHYLKTAPNGTSHKFLRLVVAPLAVCLIVAVVAYPLVLYRTPFLLVPEAWTPVRLHRISQDICRRTDPPKRVLTLGPLFGLEGGCTVYPELSAGSIAYRVADSLTPAERAITHTVGSQTLDTLLESEPPSAVVLGVEQMSFLETPLFDSAIRPDELEWERKVYDEGPIAYFRR